MHVKRSKVNPPEQAGPHHRVRVEIDGKPHATFFGPDPATAVAVADSYGWYQPEPELVITRTVVTHHPSGVKHAAYVHPEFEDYYTETQAVFYAPTEEQAVAMAEAWIEGHA